MVSPRPQIEFLNPRETPLAEIRSRGELPHLYKENGSYFVTFRLRDAITPPDQRRQWHQMQLELARETPKPIRAESADDDVVYLRQLAVRLAAMSEPSLQLGSCILNRLEVRKVVEEALLHFDDQRYQLAAWSVMPNHVHVAYTALGHYTPDSIHHSWKSYTAHKINRLTARSGPLWERESFDHLIRSIHCYEAFIEYIEQNPVAAHLCDSPSDWACSSASYFANRSHQ